MNSQLPFSNKLAHNIGLIVLASQNLERHLKFVVAITDTSEEKSVIDQHKSFEKRPLGLIVKQLMINIEGSEDDVNNIKTYFEKLIDRRNKVVHHFYDEYADDLKAENHSKILKDLADLCFELRDVARTFHEMNKFYLDNLLQDYPIEN